MNKTRVAKKPKPPRQWFKELGIPRTVDTAEKLIAHAQKFPCSNNWKAVLLGLSLVKPDKQREKDSYEAWAELNGMAWQQYEKHRKEGK